jgi:hypothetical protein
MQKTHTGSISLKASIWRLDGNQLRSLTFAHKSFDIIAKWRTLQKWLFMSVFYETKSIMTAERQ